MATRNDRPRGIAISLFSVRSQVKTAAIHQHGGKDLPARIVFVPPGVVQDVEKRVLAFYRGGAR